ncbi:AraC family transcriptional regulator [Rhizosaccharibacter radicis]|uniref:Helix-turn-helix transcriptional regulator n=1 Tax=Rhizosaccharibacter radicis TaxID=2782605 RepID=A0ABT1W0V5_9PROT|nr:helix-turn-helix transcriptional regulator [Acetobacteraceae bacterium KSS12]
MRPSLACLATPRPVAALADEYPEGFLDPRHRHGRAQLLYAASGTMAVTTDAGCTVVPPQRALWLPAGVEHEVLCRSPVSLRTLYVDDAAVEGLPAAPCVIEVSPLLRALILEAMAVDAEYEVDGRDGRLMRLVLDEIRGKAVRMPTLPMPRDERLMRLCRTLLADLRGSEDLDRCAIIAGMGRRTLTRTFREQCGMSLGSWRQQARLVSACARLTEGCTVTRAACEVGYESPSAFSAMFQRAFGTTPSAFMRRGGV